MQQNVGTIDRALRIIVGLALIAFAIFGPESAYKPWAWIGVVPLLTALVGFCPAYRLFGLRTCPAKKAS
ncbi:MAG: DUF2892 domain-containing protein [Hyphomicrobiales bacterium]|nr:DUF2892 domain-containing protein [Hyphomicrobiales bacterium]